MSASIVTVIIDDQIRDERYSQQLDTSWTTAAVIALLVERFGLPVYNMAGNRIQYNLIRSQTGEALPYEITLQQTGVRDGEELQLVSPEGRLLWKLIEKLKEEIRDYIKDKLQEKAEEKLKELKETLNKTKAEDPQAEQLSAMVDGMGGGGVSLMTLVMVGALVLTGLVIIVIVVRNLNRSGLPDDCWCEGIDLICEDGSFYPEAPECTGGEVECWCEGADLYCEDGLVERQSPECTGGEIECWCEGADLVCSDDTVEPNSPSCEGE